ncbi:MAG: anion permease, partial [Treponema sp.]|nr:anion permease [Treponema sp.]
MQRIFAFIRREAVFCIAALCALVSAFFVPPSAAYLAYIDWDTLFILFSLMAVIAALRDCGVFDRMAYVLCGHIHQLRLLCAVLILLCFCTSMLITNDVALLTFVPFTLALLGAAASGRVVLRTVVLETVAANMGSMLTPLGNPQNLFLFSKMGIGIGRFMLIILPYSVVSLGLLCLSLRLIPRTHLSVTGIPSSPAEPAPQAAVPAGRGTADAGMPDDGKGPEDADAQGTSRTGGGKPQRVLVSRSVQLVVYAALFVLCLLCVLRLVPKWIAAVAVSCILLLLNRKVLKSVDYMLLLTFAAFFVFTGNMAALPSVRTFLENAVSGHEFAVSLLCSQVISNVPATLLLYPFAQDLSPLLVGVNVGGAVHENGRDGVA